MYLKANVPQANTQNVIPSLKDMQKVSRSLQASQIASLNIKRLMKIKETTVPKATPGPPPLHPPRFPSLKHWPRNQCLFCNQLRNWKKNIILKGFVQILWHQLECPHIYLQRKVLIKAPPRWWGSEQFSGILLPVIPLDSQGETKINGN